MKIKREIKPKNTNKIEGRACSEAQSKKKKVALRVLSMTIFTLKFVLI